MNLTGGGALSVLAPLKVNASEELSGDQTVGYNHHNSRDEEQSEQQQHIPERQPEWKREKQLRGVMVCNQPLKPNKHFLSSYAFGYVGAAGGLADG